MKTATTALVLQSSGYPVKLVEQKNEQNFSSDVLRYKRSNEIFGTEKTNKLADAPESWDESWFTNYE
jgi:hypothetical protein